MNQQDYYYQQHQYCQDQYCIDQARSMTTFRQPRKGKTDDELDTYIKKRKAILEPTQAAWHNTGFSWLAQCANWTRCIGTGDYLEQSQWLAEFGSPGSDWRVRVQGSYSDILNSTTTREWFIRDPQVAYMFALRFSSNMDRGVDF